MARTEHQLQLFLLPQPTNIITNTIIISDDEDWTAELEESSGVKDSVRRRKSAQVRSGGGEDQLSRLDWLASKKP